MSEMLQFNNFHQAVPNQRHRALPCLKPRPAVSTSPEAIGLSFLCLSGVKTFQRKRLKSKNLSQTGLEQNTGDLAKLGIPQQLPLSLHGTQWGCKGLAV